MVKDYPGEQWKTVTFDFEFTNQYRLEVSNFGRIRAFHKLSDGSILNGSMINGYRIIRLKLFTPRDPKTEQKLAFLQNQVVQLTRRIKQLKQSEAGEKQVEEATALLNSLKKNISKKIQTDVKQRTIHYHALIHRLVATYFCPRPSEDHSVVAHLDFNKLNNKSTNLKWMTPAENSAHQQHSPYVIASKKERVHQRRRTDSKAIKLTVTKVMLLKKLLNQGKPLKTLVKQFKVTDTQIRRIMRGENWGDIEAAK